MAQKDALFTANAQKKSQVGQDSQNLDESLSNFKKPNSDLDIKSINKWVVF